MSNDPKRPVKQMLREFNAQRMLSKVVKGAHRRLRCPDCPPTRSSYTLVLQPCSPAAVCSTLHCARLSARSHGVHLALY